MTGINKLIEKGNICLDQRINITNAPLWHMGKVALQESKESFELLQNTIDYLSCKGQSNLAFTEDEKEFMKELFEALWWGGKYHGFHEAAILINHYVNGKGAILRIDADVYKKSVIVSDSVLALKSHTQDLFNKKLPIASLTTGDENFLRSAHCNPLRQGQRNVNTQGYILNNGALLVEQSNQRLKNADHRFYLAVGSSKSNNKFISRWKVESIYDFEPFSKGYITDIPLTKGMTLKLPDGLSHHLTKIGVAKNFTYISEWQELWG